METAAMATVVMGTADTMISTERPRHELKFVISEERSRRLSADLSRLFRHDSNQGSHGSYRVSSLYFDDPYDRALRERINGTDGREKIRLRYYGEDLGYIRIERKRKLRSLCYKSSRRISKEEAQSLIDNDMDFLLEKKEGFFSELYLKIKRDILRPAGIICYDREAFIYDPGNVRITIDRRIRGSADADRFFDSGRFDIPAMGGQCVLELKYDEFLPDICRLLIGELGSFPVSCSKYALCRRFE